MAELSAVSSAHIAVLRWMADNASRRLTVIDGIRTGAEMTVQQAQQALQAALAREAVPPPAQTPQDAGFGLPKAGSFTLEYNSNGNALEEPKAPTFSIAA